LPVRSTRAAVLAAAVLLSGRAGAASASDEEHFETKIRPVLVQTCLKCHGGEKVSGGLRVDSRESLLKGGDRGPAIVPGKPEASLLLKAVGYADEELRMPPKERLSPKVVEDFARWVRAGAVWPARAAAAAPEAAGRHWAFLPPRNVDPAAFPGTAAHPIDRLIRAAQAPLGLTPVRPADKRTLLRRVTFDLVGLPPTPEQVEAFVADDRPDAFARVVDALLASPRYGERWGRHWLDLARFADTAGDDSDYPIPQAGLYRDWVIDAFNRDQPYDEFLREQIAGDLLARAGPRDRYADRVVATGFIAQAKRFATHKHEDMHLVIEDTLSTLGQAVLALTLRCARCHDHKYDPITSQDYYALYGFFQSVVYPHAGSEEDKRPSELVPLVPESELAEAERRYQAGPGRRVPALEAEIKAFEEESETGWLLRQLKDERLAEVRGLRRALERELAEATKPTRDEIDRLRKESPRGRTPHAYAVRDGKPGDAKVQAGGDPKKPGAVVRRGFPKVLHPKGSVEIADGSSGRLELARWLTSPENPLTARVMVNRIWQHHFGKPLVPTPSNFGFQGEAPTHPELLDWLAARFVSSGWSVKAMHRLILSSQTWQLSSDGDDANAAKDSGNRYYWRFDRRRLDAEALRDTLLALGGTLRLDRPGPHPFPPVETWSFTAHHQFKAVYPSNHRSVYLMVQRLHPHPYLSLFNGADAKVTTDVRDASTVPLQALFLVNGDLVHEQARGQAERLIRFSRDPEERVKRAYEEAYGRPPGSPEVRRALAYLDRYREALAAEGVPEDRREREAWASFARVLFASNEFYHVD
jgi:cytochrome c553